MDDSKRAASVLKVLDERYYRWGREATAGDILSLTEGFTEDQVLLVTGLLEEEHPELGEECKREYVRIFYPLHGSAMEGDLESVQEISALITDIDAKSRFYGRTALIWAVICDHSDVVRYILSRGANTNPEARFRGALHYVQSVEVARLLLDHGAKINPEESLEWTPLDEAVHMWTRHRQPDLVRFLILRGAAGKIMSNKESLVRRDLLASLPEDDDVRRILEGGRKE